MPYRSTKTALIFAASATAALLVGACSQNASPAAAGTLEVGVMAPLSGDSALYGVDAVRGIDLAVKEINAAGGAGGKQISLTKVDTACEATQASTAANKLVGDNSVKVVIGNVCSGATAAAMPILERAGIPVIAAATSLPSLSQQGLKQFNRVIATDDLQTKEFVRTALVGLNSKRPAILYPSDDYGQSIAAISKKTAQDLSVPLVAEETYVAGQTKDFSAVLANIAKANPDVLLLGGYYADMGTAVNQSPRSFGSQKITLLGLGQIQTADYVKLAGPAGEGTLVSTLYDPSNSTPENIKFVAAYKAAYKEAPGLLAALGYETPYVLKAAIDANGGSIDNLSPAIRKVTYSGPVGKVVIDQNGNNTAGTSVVVALKAGQWGLDQQLTSKLTQK